MSFLLTSAAILIYLLSFTAAADVSAWKSRSIYFVLTDRIARSSSDNGGGSCSNLENYCGGTFKGLQSKLDYIQGMGFDAIWITPVVASDDGGYHGYWASDLYSINPKYGTADDLKSLINAAHAKNIFIMVDVVVNHMGSGPIANNKPSPLNDPNSYHTACTIDYNNQNSVENCRIAGLPDINTQSAQIRSLFQDWIRWLVAEYQFDGIRIDTVKHVEKDFFPSFVSAAGVYAIGEVFDGDPEHLAGYAPLMDGLLNYAVYYPMNNFYQQRGSTQALVDMLNTVNASFPDPAALGTFLDNHDNPRWLNQKNDVSLLKNALAFVILSTGIPIVYYGTEQGYAGGADPANREDLWRSGFNEDSELYQTIAKLVGAKHTAGGLTENDLAHLYVTSNAYAWSRAGANLLVLTTNAGQGSSGRHCFSTGVADGQWKSVLDGGTVSADASGNICVDVANGEPVVLVKADTPSNPTVTRTAPSTTSVCPTSVTVTFNQRVATVYGESIKIAGNADQLGNWTLAQAPSLSAAQYTAANPLWTVEVKLPSGKRIEYKFVRLTAGGNAVWESGSNRIYAVPACLASAAVDSTWR